ncbi:MAG: hypothetical protein ACLR0U_08640 [Enterocloster clostridioformis]
MSGRITPFMEFAPALEGGSGQNWNDMAKTDAPFAADTDIAKAYQKAYESVHLGRVQERTRWAAAASQATALFAQKRAAITALGDWGTAEHSESVLD